MTRQEIAQELEFRARLASTIARSIRLNVDDPEAIRGKDAAMIANADSLEYVALKIRDVAKIIRNQKIERIGT